MVDPRPPDRSASGLFDANPNVGVNDLPSQEPSDGSLSEDQCVQALVKMRDQVIRVEMENWESQRSILRDSMIETFVRQKVVDPDEWFSKVPAYLRQGTNAVEKNRYLASVCDIVARCVGPAAPEFVLTSGEKRSLPVQTQLPLGMGARSGARAGRPHDGNYVLAGFAADGIRPDASRFYDRDYQSALARMVDHVIEIEAPIYEDLLIDRIARVHGFQRSGEKIQEIVSKAVGRRFPKTKEDERTVIWAENARTGQPSPYRESEPDVRSHVDIPIVELASLAQPFVRLRMVDNNILDRMTVHFRLGRLREPTRRRFQAAIDLAKCS
jgi:hypothetical protein